MLTFYKIETVTKKILVFCLISQKSLLLGKSYLTNGQTCFFRHLRWETVPISVFWNLLSYLSYKDIQYRYVPNFLVLNSSCWPFLQTCFLKKSCPPKSLWQKNEINDINGKDFSVQNTYPDIWAFNFWVLDVDNIEETRLSNIFLC